VIATEPVRCLLRRRIRAICRATLLFAGLGAVTRHC
jgi:hypothetical protein